MFVGLVVVMLDIKQKFVPRTHRHPEPWYCCCVDLVQRSAELDLGGCAGWHAGSLSAQNRPLLTKLRSVHSQGPAAINHVICGDNERVRLAPIDGQHHKAHRELLLLIPCLIYYRLATIHKLSSHFVCEVELFPLCDC